jgi:hypothetical protein
VVGYSERNGLMLGKVRDVAERLGCVIIIAVVGFPTLTCAKAAQLRHGDLWRIVYIRTKIPSSSLSSPASSSSSLSLKLKTPAT